MYQIIFPHKFAQSPSYRPLERSWLE